jgi:hypothetical protein
MATSPVEPIAHLPGAMLPTETRVALHTAENLNVATAEALRFANEGALSNHNAFSDDAISSAAQALHDLLRLERPYLIAAGDKSGVDAADYLGHEISRFLTFGRRT